VADGDVELTGRHGLASLAACPWAPCPYFLFPEGRVFTTPVSLRPDCRANHPPIPHAAITPTAAPAAAPAASGRYTHAACAGETARTRASPSQGMVANPVTSLTGLPSTSTSTRTRWGPPPGKL